MTLQASATRQLPRSLAGLVAGDLARACVAAGTVALALPAVISLVLGPPAARSHDEFSYLLQADTFASGRLANPTHPMWPHLESFHVLQHPTYASKYPPAQGLCLALGQVVSGFPVVGSFLGYGLAAVAVCWMLGGWLSPPWSLAGALLLMARPYLVVAWGDSYWGGSLALAGSALVLGSVPRLWSRTRMVDAVALAGGLVLLANSRPFEGLLAAVVPVSAVVARRLLHPAAARRSLIPLLVPFTLLLLAGAGLMAAYNARVTGSPWRFPYLEYERQYSHVPLFSSGGSMTERRVYRHEVFRRYYEGYAEHTYQMTALAPDRWRNTARLVDLFVFRPFLGVALLVPLGLALGALAGPAAVAAASLALVFAANVASAWIFPHYFAPAAAGLYVLITLGMRRLARMRAFGRPVGALALAAVLVVAGVEAISLWPVASALTRLSRSGWAADRARFEAGLTAAGGKHVVLVRYAADHDPHHEWVYNRADVDAAPVVWARSIPGEDQRLLEFFRDRSVWLALADESRLLPIRVVQAARGEGSK